MKKMPDKPVPKKKKPFGERKSTPELVQTFGMSLDAIQTLEKCIPYLPMSKALAGMAKYLLKGVSKEEIQWRQAGTPLLEEMCEEKVVMVQHPSLTYPIPGGHYTADFLYFMASGLRINVEVKGSKFQKGYKDARARMRAAASLHPYDRFIMAMPFMGDWELDLEEPTGEYADQWKQLAEQLAQTIEGAE
jgi:hypothetical protein